MTPQPGTATGARNRIDRPALAPDSHHALVSVCLSQAVRGHSRLMRPASVVKSKVRKLKVDPYSLSTHPVVSLSQLRVGQVHLPHCSNVGADQAGVRLIQGSDVLRLRTQAAKEGWWWWWWSSSSRAGHLAARKGDNIERTSASKHSLARNAHHANNASPQECCHQTALSPHTGQCYSFLPAREVNMVTVLWREG